MANEITNFIQFDSEDLDTASGKGRISTLTDDIDIEVVPFNSENPDAPTHRVSPSHRVALISRLAASGKRQRPMAKVLSAISRSVA